MLRKRFCASTKAACGGTRKNRRWINGHAAADSRSLVSSLPRTRRQCDSRIRLPRRRRIPDSSKGDFSGPGFAANRRGGSCVRAVVGALGSAVGRCFERTALGNEWIVVVYFYCFTSPRLPRTAR